MSIFGTSTPAAGPHKLAGKVALVTGAGRGIGAAIAKRLAADGAKVVVNYGHSEQAAEGVVAHIKQHGGDAVEVKADLHEPSQIPGLFAEVKKHYGQLDILVNNAGIMERRPITEVDAGHIDKHFDLNVRGYLLCIVEAVKLLPKGGRIINISSTITRMATPGSAVYSATKGAIDVFTMTLAKELGPKGVTINSINPGYTESDMTAHGMSSTEKTMTIGMTALGRAGEPDDIADATAFLASEDARWITGEQIYVSGGLHG